MVETSSQSTWDGQPVNLAQHLVNLKETYAEHVTPAVVAYLETGVITERGKIYVHNHLHALVRTSQSFVSLPTAEKPYSFDNPAPGARHWREAQEKFAQAIIQLRAERVAAEWRFPHSQPAAYPRPSRLGCRRETGPCRVRVG